MFKQIPDNAYVDLGLPSRTIWADRNAGASNPKDFGCAFSKEDLNDMSSLTGRSFLSTNDTGTMPYKQISYSELDFGDFGSDLWNLPTLVQAEELIDYCDWTYYYNGEMGFAIKATSTVNGNSILFNLSGYFAGSLKGASAQYDIRKRLAGGEGRFWLKDCTTPDPYSPLGWAVGAYALCVNKVKAAIRPVNKAFMLPVRPVKAGTPASKTDGTQHPNVRYNAQTGQFEIS